MPKREPLPTISEKREPLPRIARPEVINPFQLRQEIENRFEISRERAGAPRGVPAVGTIENIFPAPVEVAQNVAVAEQNRLVSIVDKIPATEIPTPTDVQIASAKERFEPKLRVRPLPQRELQAIRALGVSPRLLEGLNRELVTPVSTIKDRAFYSRAYPLGWSYYMNQGIRPSTVPPKEMQHIDEVIQTSMRQVSEAEGADPRTIIDIARSNPKAILGLIPDHASPFMPNKYYRNGVLTTTPSRKAVDVVASGLDWLTQDVENIAKGIISPAWEVAKRTGGVIDIRPAFLGGPTIADRDRWIKESTEIVYEFASDMIKFPGLVVGELAIGPFEEKPYQTFLRTFNQSPVGTVLSLVMLGSVIKGRFVPADVVKGPVKGPLGMAIPGVVYKNSGSLRRFADSLQRELTVRRAPKQIRPQVRAELKNVFEESKRLMWEDAALVDEVLADGGLDMVSDVTELLEEGRVEPPSSIQKSPLPGPNASKFMDLEAQASGPAPARGTPAHASWRRANREYDRLMKELGMSKTGEAQLRGTFEFLQREHPSVWETVTRARDGGVRWKELKRLRNEHLEGRTLKTATKGQIKDYVDAVDEARKTKPFDPDGPPPRTLANRSATPEVPPEDLGYISRIMPTDEVYHRHSEAGASLARTKRAGIRDNQDFQQSKRNFRKETFKDVSADIDLDVGVWGIAKSVYPKGVKQLPDGTVNITFPNGMKYSFKLTDAHRVIDKALDVDYASTFKVLVKKKILHPRRFRKNYRPKIHDQNPRMIDQFREDTHPGNDVPIDLGMSRLVDDAGVAVKEGFFEKPRTSVQIPDEFMASRQHQIYMRQAGRRAFLTDTIKEARLFIKKFPKQEALRQFVVEDINTSIGYPTSLDLYWNNSLHRLKGALGDRPAESVMRFLKDLEYTGGLGFNLTSPLKNITQLSNTAGEVGISWTAFGFADFALDVMLYPFRRVKAKIGRTNPHHPFSRAHALGVVREFAPELYSKGRGIEVGTGAKAVVKKWGGDLRDGMLKIFEYSDRINREVTIRASTMKWDFYKRKLDSGRITRTQFLDRVGTKTFLETKRSFVERELKAGRDLSSKTAFLDEVVRKTQFWYETGQGPLIFRGQIKGGLLGVYGTWPLNYARLLKSWGENRAIMNFVRHAAAHYAFGSAFQMAGYDVWDWMFGDIRVAAGAFEGVPALGKLFERGVPVIPFFGPLTRRIEGAIAAQLLASVWDIGVGFSGAEERQFASGIWGLRETALIHLPGGVQWRRIVRAMRSGKLRDLIISPKTRPPEEATGYFNTIGKTIQKATRRTLEDVGIFKPEVKRRKLPKIRRGKRRKLPRIRRK